MSDRMQRRRYVKGMLAAIERTRKGCGMMKDASKTQGLRCIREFEQINGFPFDPRNNVHISTVSGMGPFSATFWRIRTLSDGKGEG